jgi:hypothetical protein
VHSSTSSFRTLPHGWLSLAVGGFLALLALGAWEMLWRSRGFVPSLTDSEALWCHERREVVRDSIVIVGSSRVQKDLDPDVLSRSLDGRSVVQLALAGGDGFPVLADLARDPSFAGVVVIEYMPRRILTADATGVARMDGFLAWCRDPNIIANTEGQLDRALQRRVVGLNPELHPITILSYAYAHHRLPHGSHEVLRDDRFSATSFAGGSGTSLDRWDEPLPVHALAERLERARADIAAIHARGGRVVLFRPPVTGEVLADEERRFPSGTWLPTVARELGVPAIDFLAVPELRALPCPDGEHLDESDAPAATAAVARELRALL